MTGRVVYLNGRYLPEAEARISIFDSAVVMGDMAFESTRTFGGEPFALETHLNRLFGTLEILQLDCGVSPDDLEAITLETLSRNRLTENADMEWQIVHNISFGPVQPYHAAFSQSELSPTICINCWPLISQLASLSPFYERGQRLVVPEQRAIPWGIINPHAKTRSRVHARLAQIAASRIDAGSWPLLLDTEGYLAEGPSWNIFLVRDGRILTPSTRNVLPGVSRSRTLELSQEYGIPAEEADLTVDDARNADEMFCTATSFCVLPVSSFEGKTLGTACPGPITQKLSTAWQRLVGVDFIAQAQQAAIDLPAWRANESASD